MSVTKRSFGVTHSMRVSEQGDGVDATLWKCTYQPLHALFVVVLTLFNFRRSVMYGYCQETRGQETGRQETGR